MNIDRLKQFVTQTESFMHYHVCIKIWNIVTNPRKNVHANMFDSLTITVDGKTYEITLKEM